MTGLDLGLTRCNEGIDVRSRDEDGRLMVRLVSRGTR